ncbi:peptidase M48 [Marinobacterium nitratireducens]|uniref:Peptidase M48 n=1 Tax=Marinobacterium nitratireducens TaxID=518897 RepID=A0A917Z8E7_9GAMM|nr:M48 family metallopeptidase [Marinobacterium nitratireducens]GGO77964.1 peptidase M48 [Marinobacterium nitratireducens]
MTELDGYLYDGRSSARRAVRLSVDDDGRVRLPDGSLLSWRALSVSTPAAGGPRFLELPAGLRFETAQYPDVDRLERRFRPGAPGQRLHRMESRWRWVLLALLLVILAGAGGLRYGLPALAKTVAFRLPASVSEHSSRQTLAALDRWLLAPTQLPPQQQQRLQALFDELAGLQPAEFDYRLHLRDGGDLGANALALPSGQIILTDQLVRLSPHPDALAGVLAHEIAHVQHRHGLRRALQSSALPLLIVTATGDLNAAGSLLVALPTLLIERHYSRSFEREADRFALRQLQDLNRDPAPLVKLLRRLEANQAEGGQPLPDWLRTHPGNAERRHLLTAD